jgi:hypothetical protein
MKSLLSLLCGVALCCVAIGFAQTAPPVPQVVPQTVTPALIVSSATILSWRDHSDEAGARFCFRDERVKPKGAEQRPGDLIFNSTPPVFTCRKHTADQSTIVDLGEKTWAQIDALPAQKADWAYKVPAVAGHAYLVHVDDTESDFWAIFRTVNVTANITENDRCDIEWVRLEAAKPETAPKVPAEVQHELAALLVNQDENVDPAMLLHTPRIVLQVRSGAGGGNPNRIDMIGKTTAYIHSISPTPLKFDVAPTINDRAVAYSSGGLVPKGKCLIVKTITYHGTANGDTNGPGAFVLHVGKTEIENKRDVPEIAITKWEGRIEIHHGEESQVYLEVRNSSSADVLIEGELSDVAGK